MGMNSNIDELYKENMRINAQLTHMITLAAQKQEQREIMIEKDIERQVRLEAIAAGWLVRKLMSPGHSGFPDRLFAKNGKIVFIELKKPGEKPRPRQLNEIAALMHAGVHAAWSDSIEDVRLILDLPTPK